ncbi:hypothetical protein [Blastomonas sp. SL216]|uniref:hypothetical protein n=1 Tax=Blastomonas sp. SL216 TaxID=2995169 RepID=UPI002377C63D|nr:hypothetical protein OU999_03180 [Blastomonas sp. SL216]
MGYRPEFIAALRMFAQISEAMAMRGFTRPILVGGAAAEFYTGSAISTMDFDICCIADDTLAQARELYRLNSGCDPEYLDRQLREETLGEFGVDILRQD